MQMARKRMVILQIVEKRGANSVQQQRKRLIVNANNRSERAEQIKYAVRIS
jgi:hypothetical protein